MVYNSNSQQEALARSKRNDATEAAITRRNNAIISQAKVAPIPDVCPPAKLTLQCEECVWLGDFTANCECKGVGTYEYDNPLYLRWVEAR